MPHFSPVQSKAQRELDERLLILDNWFQNQDEWGSLGSIISNPYFPQGIINSVLGSVEFLKN